MKSNNNANNNPPHKGKTIAAWLLQILLAAVFISAGFAMLSGQPVMVEQFKMIGAGQWFRYATGGIEIFSAVLLLMPRLAPAGAVLLIVTMGGAVLVHLLKIGGSPMPAVVFGCMAAALLWLRLNDAKTLLKQFTRN